MPHIDVKHAANNACMAHAWHPDVEPSATTLDILQTAARLAVTEGLLEAPNLLVLTAMAKHLLA